MIIFLLLVVSIIVSFFILYTLVKHDFVLARKSILLQEIFDTTLISYLAFLLTGRLLYVVAEQKFSYFHFLRFFHVLRFPGILFLGGLVGLFFVITYVFRKRKILFRIFDIYSLSLYPLFVFALLTSYNSGYFLYFNILLFLLSVFFFCFGLYSYSNYTLNDGSVFLLFVCLIAIFTIISDFANGNRIIFSLITISQALAIFVFFGFSTVLIMHEGMIGKKK